MKKGRRVSMTVTIRERAMKKGGTTLFLDFYYRHTHKYLFLGLHTMPGNDSTAKEHNKECFRLANIVRSRKELEIRANALGLESIFKSDSSLFEFIGKHSETMKPNSKQNYISLVNHLKAFFQSEDVLFSRLNEQTARDFKEFLLKTVTANSAFLYFSFFKAIVSAAVKQGFLQNNIMRNVDSIKKTEVVKDYLTPNELELLFRTECNNPEIRKAFLFSCFTGLRISDVENLRYENIEGNKISFRQVKTGGLNYIPLSETAADLLNEGGTIRNIDGKVFNLPSQTAISNTIKKWFENAGITKKLTFHSSRHTFAIISLISGVNIAEVSKLLGHSDIKTTQVYAKIVDELKEKAMAKLPVYKLSN